MQELSEQEVLQILHGAQAVREGHFVGTNGPHLSHYVAKDMATKLASRVEQLCFSMAARFANDNIEVVVAPAVGGIALSQATAKHLARWGDEPYAVYAEPDDRVIFTGEGEGALSVFVGNTEVGLLGAGEKLIIRPERFALRRGFAEDVRGKRVLVVEDTLTTGGSANKVVKATEDAGGVVIGLAVIVNGGSVTAEACGVKRLEALTTVKREVYSEADCADHGLCAKRIKINTDFGHGASFLARQQQS